MNFGCSISKILLEFNNKTTEAYSLSYDETEEIKENIRDIYLHQYESKTVSARFDVTN